MLDSKHIKVDQRVALERRPQKRGTISSLANFAKTYKVTVKWDDGSQEDIYDESLIPEDLSDLYGDIISKFEQAGNLIKEANDLASKEKLDLFQLSNIADPLMSALENVGWSTSSMSC